MNVLDIVFIGIALSMDACALTIANCSMYKNVFDRKKTWAMPVFFSVFQGAMPLIGYFVGGLFAEYLKSYAGYIVSAIFLALGIKIVIDIVKEKMNKVPDSEKNERNLSFSIILIQALATSIDALIVGVSLRISLTFSVFFAALIITAVTAILVCISLAVGKNMHKTFGKYAEWIGAVILFSLSIKELVVTIV